MSKNPILEEIYAARTALLAACNNDLHTCVEEARKRALASGHKIAAPRQQTKRCAGLADADGHPSANLVGSHQAF
jgi:hypothetical protein